MDYKFFTELGDDALSMIVSLVAAGIPLQGDGWGPGMPSMEHNWFLRGELADYGVARMTRSPEENVDVLLNDIEESIFAPRSPITRPSPNFLPTSLADATALAAALSADGGAALPFDLRAKPATVLAVILTGAELGIPPMHAIQGLWVGDDGKVHLHADTMVAVCLGRGRARSWSMVEETETEVTYQTERPDGMKFQWTWKDADSDAAGLSTLPHWVAYKRQMRRARCKSALARDAYPDVLAGFYSTEEASDGVTLVEQLRDGVAFDVEQAAKAAPRSFEPAVEPIPEEV